MRELIKTGFVFNASIAAMFLMLSKAWSLGYLLGSFAMLANMLLLAAGQLFGTLGFLSLIAVTYWAYLQGDMSMSLFAYALGLASPACYALIWAYR